MPLGDQNLTEVSREQAMTAPGMAYFAGSGPPGKTCGDCKFRGYRKEGTSRFSPSKNQYYTPMVKMYGCAKYKNMTGRHGDRIDEKLHACKYFVQCPKEA